MNITETIMTVADPIEESPDPESVLSALEQAIRDVCDEDTQNAISDRYRELMGEPEELEEAR